MGSWAALAYLPVPGWQFVPALAAPADRLVRFHAWQAGVQALLLWLVLLALGLATPERGGAARTLGLVAGLWLALNLALMAGAAWGAGRGRWARVQPAAALLSLLGK